MKINDLLIINYVFKNIKWNLFELIFYWYTKNKKNLKQVSRIKKEKKFK
jgi:hypothetical protein